MYIVVYKKITPGICIYFKLSDNDKGVTVIIYKYLTNECHDWPFKISNPDSKAAY